MIEPCSNLVKMGMTRTELRNKHRRQFFGSYSSLFFSKMRKFASKQFIHLFSDAEGMRIVSSGSTSVHLRSWIGISVLDCGPEDIVPDNVCFGLLVRAPFPFRDLMTWFLTSITNKVIITETGFISQSANFDLGNFYRLPILFLRI